MATNFPTTLDTSTEIPAESASTPLSTNHVTAHTNLADAVIALETKVGVDGSADTDSLDYKLSGVTGSDKSASLAGTEALTNKTLTSPVINVGSDAEGDTYYRNSSGILTRLAKGTDNYIYKMNGNVPNWEAEAVISNATSSAVGIVELATASEITAGTASGSAGPLAITPDQLALSTPVFNGSGLTSVGIHKCGTTTKDASDSSTTQNIAHGVGKTPKWVKIIAKSVITASTGATAESITIYDGTTQSSQSVWASNTSTFTTDTSFKINTNTGAGANQYNSGVVTLDSTNIIITWTKNGASPSGTYQILWEAHY